MNKNYYIETYGCQMNVYDSELVSGQLNSLGYKKTNKLDDDAYFGQYTQNLNKPDAIKKKAEKVLKIIKELKNLK